MARTRRLTGLLAVLGLGLAGLTVATATSADAAGFRTAADGAKITKRTQVDKHMFDLTLNSPDLGTAFRQAPADGTHPHVRVIVPPGWKQNSKKTWPVVYAYHGGEDDYTGWTLHTDLEKLAIKWKALVVLPEGGLGGSYTNWYNYGKGGPPKWESFHLKEVPQLLQRNFHASSTKVAAMGLSSGAGGAVSYAARHPGFFKYVASFSGLVALTLPNIQAMLIATDTYSNNQFQDPYRIWGIPGINQGNWNAHDPYQHVPALKGTGLYLSSGTTGLQGALDPTPANPLTYVLDYALGATSELEVGQTNQALLARMKSDGFAIQSCTGHKDGAPFVNASSCRSSVYSAKMAMTGVTTDIYGAGWHDWAHWQVEMHKAWPLIMKAIGAKKA